MQTLWVLKYDWDDQLPESVLLEWRDLAGKISRLREFMIPRWLEYGHHTQLVELVGFCDASYKAYSAVVYIRMTDECGLISTKLLTAKTRVAPLKVLSIPKLELQGAVLLTQLIGYTQSLLLIKVDKIHCFSDSKIVLAWIAKPSYNWSIFVGNRVSLIQSELPEVRWGHVKTKDNPADLNSRGISANDLLHSSRWWDGPEWLRGANFAEQVNQKEHFETEEELKSSIRTLHQVIDGGESLLTRFSSWSKLVKVMAYILRVVKRKRESSLRLTHADIERAKAVIFRLIQQVQFPQERQALLNEKSLIPASKLLKLNPRLDENGVLRVGGRLLHSELTSSEKHPVILAQHFVTELLVRHVHLSTMHGGLQLTLRTLRQSYWLLGGRAMVKRIVHSCITCKRQSTKPLCQLMADLPPQRCTMSKPFANTGIDYAGPYDVRVAPGRGHKSYKAWIALFVCLATKAIHLELVSNYTTEGFLAAFDRFVSRRGLPSMIFSDNGTNFHGAASALHKAAVYSIRKASEMQCYAIDGLEWRFIPPAAPHFGGLWEAGVKSMKFHLRRSLRDANPTYEEMTTILTRIEACLNSRPLWPLDDNVESLEALTPGHFLIGSSLKASPTSLSDDNLDLRSRWSRWTQAANSVWKAWKADYLNHLQQRNKWQNTQNTCKEGDLVILKSPLTPQSIWPLARVLAVHPGSDGLVRVVTLKTKSSTLTRPITQICPLLPAPMNSHSTHTVTSFQHTGFHDVPEKPLRGHHC